MTLTFDHQGATRALSSIITASAVFSAALALSTAASAIIDWVVGIEFILIYDARSAAQVALGFTIAACLKRS